MRWFSFFGAVIVGVCMLGAPSQAQVLIEDNYIPVAGEPYINNRPVCMVADGLTVTVRCALVTDTEAIACPSGPCFSSGTGCQYYPANNDKQLQREQVSTGQYDQQPIDVARTTLNAKKVEEIERKICYKERQCLCEENLNGDFFCKAKPWFEYGIARYQITDVPCPVLVSYEP